ncbi:MAG: Unknown protein [uncultured Sulfurovum sp.]|uniref:DUF4296 domain-containing protein n=1 Tax=uncultured Sulfurovum sp. TaxID=269237 RepID=A0A6S6SCX1_9BACT|nr:MAG: Unknown protein [uncultured Sulfurovum sp.]
MKSKKIIYFVLLIFLFLGCAKKPVPIVMTSVIEFDYLQNQILQKLHYLSETDKNAKVLVKFFNWNLEIANLDSLYYLNTEGYGIVFYNFEKFKINKKNIIDKREFLKIEEMINIKFTTISNLSKNYFPKNSKRKSEE